jgi:Carboxypeptidase regulatory-like domain
MSRITRTRSRTAEQGGTNFGDISTRHRNQSSQCPDRCHSTTTRLVLALLATVLVCSVPGSGQEPNSNGAGSGAASIIGQVKAIAARGQTEELAGVEVKLTDVPLGKVPVSALSDDEGHFEFTKLARGTYRLEASPEGFQPSNATVTIGQDQSAVEAELILHINSAVQGLEVRADASEISAESSELKSSLSAEDIDNLPLAEQKFSDALSLSPGVVRTPEGKLNFNGQSESEGVLLLNSTENVDPVSGSFSIPLPIDVIQSMTVHDAPDTAEYGGFSGGLTQIETKAPSDTWHYRVHDFLPGFRGKNGVLRGIADFTPRFVFGGPLVKGKLNFTEELTWEVRNQPIRGLPWPYNETRTRAASSFTEFQAILSPRHLLDVNVNAFPLRRRFADINALIPQDTSSNYNQNGASVGISDSYQWSSGALLNTVFRYTRFVSDGEGQGVADMLITPEGWGGNFFDSWSRTGNELEFRPAFQFPTKNWHGQHELKVGMDVSRRDYAGTNISHPVELLREDGSLAEQIAFEGSGLLHGAATEVAEFVEDHWRFDGHLAINVGARVASQSIGRGAAFGPHVAAAYSPDGKTVIRFGTGLFYGHVPLLAADFTDNPARLISFFGPSGSLIGEPILLRNAYLLSRPGAPIQFVQTNPGTSPRTFSAHVELERELTRNLSMTLSYLNSETEHLFILNPLISSTAGGSLLGLANDGSSHYDQFDVTVHARPLEHSELNFSYVWSRSRGDLNTLSDLFVPFEQPVIRPNVSGVLSSDVPHRFVGWGVLPLPWKFSFSPVVDVHSGLPYSAVDVLQNYFGVPNNFRFPTYFSLDIKVYREFPLRVPFMGRSSSRKLRFGIYSIDVTNHQNANAVYNEIASPFFGRFAGFDRRIDGFVIDFMN